MFLNLSYETWGVACLIVAALNAITAPKSKAVSVAGSQAYPAWRRFILRWFHALVWVCLGVSFFIRERSNSLSDWIALFGLVLYFVFLAFIVLEKRAGQLR